ncbi:MAG: acyl-CoA synthetase, partial [Ferrovum sp.]|nr:acyl-CoA synthetase [Ferrovum sp.]
MTGTRQTSVNDKTPEWLKNKERGNRFWLRVMCKLSLLLGRQLSRTVLYGIALYFLLAAPAARHASRQYLERVLARPVTWFDLYQHFFSFSSTIHDRIYLLNNRYDLFDLRISGAAPIHALHAANRGSFLFGAHFGSFEMLRSIARDHPTLKVCAAMYSENARQINDTLSTINPGFMLDIILLGQVDSMLEIHQKLKEGFMIGILADRASGPDQYLSIPFLGSQARFPTGPFRMAVLLRQPIYIMTGLYRGGNRYDIQFELLADFSKPSATSREEEIHELLAKYVTALEHYCHAAPYNWFNFYDFW